MGEVMLLRVVFVAGIIAGIVDGAPTRMVNDQAFVDQINALNPGWTAAASPRFDGMPLSAFKTLNGVKPGSWANVVAKLPYEANNHITSIPDSFDSEANWPQCAKVIGDIRDQSMCGCCWAFAGASAASDRLCIATNGSIQVPLSAQDVCFCSSPDGCQGGQITLLGTTSRATVLSLAASNPTQRTTL